MKYKEGDIVYLRPWGELRKQKGFRRYEEGDWVHFDDNCGSIFRNHYEQFFGKPLTVIDYDEDDGFEVPVCYKLSTDDCGTWWFGETYIQTAYKKLKYFNRRG